MKFGLSMGDALVWVAGIAAVTWLIVSGNGIWLIGIAVVCFFLL